MLFHRTPGRRRLRFACYDDIIDDIERVRTSHRTLGHWTLAQICHHLADTQVYSVEPAEPEIQTSRLFRATVGRFALRVLLWFRYIPERQGHLAPLPPVDFDAAVGRLRQTLRRVSAEPMVAAHPIFGRLTQRQWRLFHLHHAAHHLGFVVPQAEPARADPEHATSGPQDQPQKRFGSPTTRPKWHHNRSDSRH